jgi:cell division protein ZapA
MKQIEVTILGQSYILGCPEGGERELLQAVSTVDREMSAIRDAGKVKARERMAVLAALNLAYQLAELPAPAPAPQRSAPGSAEAEADTGELDLDALIARVDSALGSDGHLL